MNPNAEEQGPHALVKLDHCYVGDRFKAEGFAQINAKTPLPACLQPGCRPREPVAGSRTNSSGGAGLTFRMETYYARINNTFVSAPCCKPR